jgi:cullin 3
MHFKIRQTTLDAINGRFLEVLNKMWNEHTTAMVMIRDILMYMDRIYVQNTTIPVQYFYVWIK